MAKNLAECLESLSGYRHVFPPNHPDARLNPVVFSHLRVVVGGRPYHILSRIGAAGLDYTQRSNKLAHHIALDAHEQVPAGPAELLADVGFMESTWEGEPRVVTVARKPPQIDSIPKRCTHWEKLTGDAGWGGWLSESALNEPRKSIVIVYQPGTDVLALVVESLGLVPPPIRWQVTFSTYYTKLPPGIECQWRFVLAGSPEAKAAARSPQIVSLELSKTIGRAPDAPLVEAARTGIVASVPSASIIRPMALETTQGPHTPPSNQFSDAQLGLSDKDQVPLDIGVSLELPPVPRNARRFQRVNKPSLRSWPIVAAGSLIVLLLIGATIYLAGNLLRQIVWNQSDQQSSITPLASDAERTNNTQTAEIEKQTAASPVAVLPDQENSTNSPTTELSAPSAPTPTKPVLPDSNAVPNTQTTIQQPDVEPSRPEQAREHSSDKPPAVTVLFADVLPPQQGGQIGGPRSSPVPLSETNGDAWDLRLIGGDDVLKSQGKKITIKNVGSPTSGRHFELELKPLQSGAALSGDVVIATIVERSGRLEFQWERDSSSTTNRKHADQLRNCIIRLTGEMPKDIALRSQVIIDAITVRCGVPNDSVQFDLDPWPPWPLRLQVQDSPNYKVTVGSDGSVTLVHTTDENMPKFRLTIDKVNKEIDFSFTCPFDDITTLTEERLVARLNQLTDESKTLSGDQERIRQKRSKLQTEEEKKADDERLREYAEKLARLGSRIRVIEQCQEFGRKQLVCTVVAVIEGEPFAVGIPK